MASTAQRVLLTGGAGFIGSHLAEALLRRGFQLAIVDELNGFYSPQRKEENLAEVRRSGTFEFVQQDICNKPGLHAIFKRFRPDVVVHLAPELGIGSTNQSRERLRSGLAGQGDCAQQNMSRRRVRWSPQQMLNSTSGGQFATNIGQGRNEGVTHKNLDAYAIHSIVRG